MRSRKHRIVRIISVMLLLVLLIPGISANAASKKKALKAYKRLLSKNKIMIGPWKKDFYPERIYKGSKKTKVRFSLAYLDSDKIPELFVYHPEVGYSIFRYKNGRVVRAWSELGWVVPRGYYYKTGMYRIDYDTEGYLFTECYKRYKPGKAKYLFSHEYWDDYDENDNAVRKHEYYTVAIDDEITKAYFELILKKYTKNKNMIRFVMRKNTAKNRKKYLK